MTLFPWEGFQKAAGAGVLLPPVHTRIPRQAIRLAANDSIQLLSVDSLEKCC
jgi:hypothetical protein